MICSFWHVPQPFSFILPLSNSWHRSPSFYSICVLIPLALSYSSVCRVPLRSGLAANSTICYFFTAVATGYHLPFVWLGCNLSEVWAPIQSFYFHLDTNAVIFSLFSYQIRTSSTISHYLATIALASCPCQPHLTTQSDGPYNLTTSMTSSSSTY